MNSISPALQKSISFLLLSCFIFCCASPYRVANTRNIEYVATSTDAGLEMQYKYDVLRASGNKKYARKASDKKIQVVAFEFYNNSDYTFNLEDDVAIYAGNNEVVPVDPMIVRKKVKQVSGLYMLWSLLILTYSDCQNGDCNTTPIPIGLVIGLINLGAASRANSYFQEDLIQNSLKNKIIEPGETVHAVLPLNVDLGEPLQIRIRD